MIGGTHNHSLLYRGKELIMSGKGEAFLKGGCGCLVAFLVLGLIFVAIGGNMQIDIAGAACLFVAGGSSVL